MIGSNAFRFGGEAGFTLLELLVTLALLSLLSLALFGSIRYGTRIWEASRGIEAQTESVRHAEQTLFRLVSTAYPKFVAKDALHASVAFSGDAASLELMAPDTTLPGALDVVIIHQTESASGGALVVERKLELGAESQQPDSERLLTGVRQVSFEYFGPRKPGAKPEWQSSWIAKTRPPRLVRITAVLDDRSVAWPDLIVAPQIEADVSCTFDAVSGFCQGR